MSRIERDSIGEVELPDSAYYGVQTLRGKQNFRIVEILQNHEPDFIRAYAYVKKAAAMANRSLGSIPDDVAGALVSACDEIIAGRHRRQFVTDWIQGGAGASMNANMDEVICNLALEKLGGQKGDYGRVNPADHASFGQSTNDVYPTALRIAALMRVKTVETALEELVEAFYEKADEFRDVLKMGRTHLTDAVPMTLGQEFRSWGSSLEAEMAGLRHAKERLRVVNLGGTAIGTGVTNRPEYPRRAVGILSRLTGLDLVLAEDLVAASSDCGAYVSLSGSLRSLATKLTKVCNDIRFMASGPRCGLSEIRLPQMQPGSSIMPGKVNPVIPEVTNQACFLTIGLDQTVMLSASAGQFELNVMEPVLTFALFTEMKVMKNACNTLREKCITGIQARPEHTGEMVRNAISNVTLLKPRLGYATCSEIAHECYDSGKSLYQVCVEERKLLSPEEWDRIFSPESLVAQKFT